MTPLSRLCSMWGRFLEGFRGALPQDSLTSPPGLLHDTLVSPVLHAREIFRRVQGSTSPGFSHISPRTAPWHPCLACAPREGDFLNSLEEDHLPTYSVVMFWQGEFSAGSARPPPCHMQSTTACLCSMRGKLWEGGRDIYVKRAVDFDKCEDQMRKRKEL